MQPRLTTVCQFRAGTGALHGLRSVAQPRTVAELKDYRWSPATTFHRSALAQAKPNSKLPARVVSIYCSKCRTQLYKYHKNGNGKLVKCWHERIAEDYTAKDLKCPSCGQQFARPAMIRGLPANKIISGKVTLKR